MMTTVQLESTLRQLRLSGLGRTLPVRLQEAAAGRLDHAEFLELILQDELNVRQERRLENRKRLAQFRALKTLEDFDWRFNPQIPKKEIFELAAGQFIAAADDALFLGPPGLGKTHLAQAIGYEAIKQGRLVRYVSIFDLIGDLLQEEALQQKERALRQYLKPDLLIIDDMGLKQLPKHSVSRPSLPGGTRQHGRDAIGRQHYNRVLGGFGNVGIPGRVDRDAHRSRNLRAADGSNGRCVHRLGKVFDEEFAGGRSECVRGRNRDGIRRGRRRSFRQ